jgi:hypothetical protein
MPIRHVYPPTQEAIAAGVPMFVWTDAPTNAQAILEIDDWCRQQGLQRARESHLGTLSTVDYGRVWQGICYRPPEAQVKQEQKEWEELKRRLESMPETAPLVDDPLED